MRKYIHTYIVRNAFELVTVCRARQDIYAETRIHSLERIITNHRRGDFDAPADPAATPFGIGRFPSAGRAGTSCGSLWLKDYALEDRELVVELNVGEEVGDADCPRSEAGTAVQPDLRRGELDGERSGLPGRRGHGCGRRRRRV